MKTWPVDWPRYKQSSEICDAIEGPCSCGAAHQLGEFELRDGTLYRYGTSVLRCVVRISVFDELKRENQRLRVRLEMRDSKNFVDKAVNFIVTARDAHGNSREFNFESTGSVLSLREMIQTVLDNMPSEHLFRALQGAQDE